jgi:subtilisin
MIDVHAMLRKFWRPPARYAEDSRLLRCPEDCHSSAGRGIVAGLLDTGLDEHVLDLTGADLVTSNFSATNGSRESHDHGTHSVTLLIGQGRFLIRGIVPRARLLFAKVAGSEGVVRPQDAAAAIEWLVSMGAQVVAIPLGSSAHHREISEQIQSGAERGVLFFAAAGNHYPSPVLFPARHPSAIAVGAADREGRLLSDCCSSPRLDVVAPGLKLPAVVGGNIIRRRSGSSVACILAAGTAALAFPRLIQTTSSL